MGPISTWRCHPNLLAVDLGWEIIVFEPVGCYREPVQREANAVHPLPTQWKTVNFP